MTVEIVFIKQIMKAENSMYKTVFLMLNFIYYKGLILKPILAPVLIATHHLNRHLPSLENVISTIVFKSCNFAKINCNWKFYDK